MNTSDDMVPQPPAEQEPLPELARGVFDLVDETAAQITDTDVTDRLRHLLRTAGHADPLGPAAVADGARNGAAASQEPVQTRARPAAPARTPPAGKRVF